MKRRWIPVTLGVILALVAVVAVSLATHQQLFGDIIPSNVPEGTTFQPLSELSDWNIRPALKIVPNASKPGSGLASVNFEFEYTGQATLEDVQVAIFLPDALQALTPMATYGTNQQKSHMSVSPEHPGFSLINSFTFPRFEDRDYVKGLFEGASRVKITWKGGERYVEVPFSHWNVEVTPKAP